MLHQARFELLCELCLFLHSYTKSQCQYLLNIGLLIAHFDITCGMQHNTWKTTSGPVCHQLTFGYSTAV